MTRFGRAAFALLVWLFIIAIPVQFYLAGVGAFKASSYDAHAMLGTIMGVISLLILISAAVSRVGNLLLIHAAALFALMIVQTLLGALNDSARWVAALHPVNALLIIGVVVVLGMRSREYLPFGRFQPQGSDVGTESEGLRTGLTS